MLVFSEFDAGLLDPCANAVLALVVCDPPAYGAMVNALLARQPDAAVRARLAASFTRLTAGNGVVTAPARAALRRLNRNRFKKNMRAFVSAVRGYIRTN